jgi:hypothetical protein
MESGSISLKNVFGVKQTAHLKFEGDAKRIPKNAFILFWTRLSVCCEKTTFSSRTFGKWNKLPQQSMVRDLNQEVPLNQACPLRLTQGICLIIQTLKTTLYFLEQYL